MDTIKLSQVYSQIQGQYEQLQQSLAVFKSPWTDKLEDSYLQLKNKIIEQCQLTINSQQIRKDLESEGKLEVFYCIQAVLQLVVVEVLVDSEEGVDQSLLRAGVEYFQKIKDDLKFYFYDILIQYYNYWGYTLLNSKD